jgi:plastocyanin domain-containing protein
VSKPEFKENRMIKYISILLFLLMPVLAFSAEENVFVAETGPDGVQRIELTAGSYFFKPEHIVVKAGVPVELAIKNESKIVPHNFVMKSPEAGMEFSESLSNNLTTVRFTPDKPGKYTFYCDKKLLFFKSHRDRGMEGVIEVR